MKRLALVGLGSILLLPFLSTAAVIAETTNTTTTPNSSNTASAGDDAQAEQERIQEHKTDLKTKLSTADKLVVQNKCKAAQGLVSSVSNRIKGIQTSRSEVYKNMIDRLTDLSTKLKNKGANTTALDADIATLKTKIDTFNTDLVTYKQTVSDLASMDCKADPEGFRATLDTARTEQQKVTTDSQAIRDYLNNTIKPLLKQIREQLGDNKTNTENTQGSH